MISRKHTVCCYLYGRLFEELVLAVLLVQSRVENVDNYKIHCLYLLSTSNVKEVTYLEDHVWCCAARERVADMPSSECMAAQDALAWSKQK